MHIQGCNHCLWCLSAGNSTSTGTVTASTWSCCYIQPAPENPWPGSILCWQASKVCSKSWSKLNNNRDTVVKVTLGLLELGWSHFSSPFASDFDPVYSSTHIYCPEYTASLLTILQQCGQRAKACVDNTGFLWRLSTWGCFSKCEYQGVSDLCTCKPSIFCLHLTSHMMTTNRLSLTTHLLCLPTVISVDFVQWCPTPAIERKTVKTFDKNDNDEACDWGQNTWTWTSFQDSKAPLFVQPETLSSNISL